MADLSPDCIARLRQLDGQLDRVAMVLKTHISSGATRRLNLDGHARAMLTEPLTRAGVGVDDECKKIFRELEPKLGFVVRSIGDDELIDVIQGYLKVARHSLQAALRRP